MPSSSNEDIVDCSTGGARVHWYRHGLRLHDNPALLSALEGADEFFPIFIFDGEVAGTKTSGYNRWRFLIESLKDLDDSFREVGGRLYVFQGDPVDIFGKLVKEWGIKKVTFEQDPEPIWQDRDQGVKRCLDELEVQWEEFISHTLWDPKEIIEKNGGIPPHTFELFNLVAGLCDLPERPVANPNFDDVKLPVVSDYEARFAVPTLESLGIKPEFPNQNERINEWKGGESNALRQLMVRMGNEEKSLKMGVIHPNQIKPNLTGPPLSLSAHLRFGCVSVRKFFWSLYDCFSRVSSETDKMNTPIWILASQLIWREYFYVMSINNKYYNTMVENPICLNIPWTSDAEKLKRWEMGETGYPWIDACMNQLRQEGWVHHVCRHAVSCFLTRGDLWLSWEEGLKIFDKYLMDADWSVCAGNWMWVSSSAFENCLSCPRCYSPVMYGMMMDATGEFVRRYVPKLKDMPLKFLFQPWKAPLEVQQAAGCVVGRDYPEPMVNHGEASKYCRAQMEEVKACLKNPDILHCAPSNKEEAMQFAFIPYTKTSCCAGNDSCNNVNERNVPGAV